MALTRARDRLYVCGTLKPQATDKTRGWHALVTSALEPESTRRELAGGSVELEWRAPVERLVPARGKQEAMAFAPQRPPWLGREPPPGGPPIRRISPSSALEMDGPVRHRRPGPISRNEGAEQALERGRLIHRLFQSLPEAAPYDRRVVGRRYLDAVAKLPETERAALLDEVLAVLDHPDFASVFAPGSRAEVEIAGSIGTSRLSGRIDRLAVTPEAVLVVDYKTNRPAPSGPEETPHDYVIQLALYREILRRLYPNRRLSAAILWTDRPALMEIPSAILDDAAKATGEAAS